VILHKTYGTISGFVWTPSAISPS